MQWHTDRQTPLFSYKAQGSPFRTRPAIFMLKKSVDIVNTAYFGYNNRSTRYRQMQMQQTLMRLTSCEEIAIISIIVCVADENLTL